MKLVNKKLSWLFFVVSCICLGRSVFAKSTKDKQVHRPLKVLFILKRFPIAIQTFFVNQITEFRDAGHDVYIFAQGPGRKNPDIEKYDWRGRIFYNEIPEDKKEYDIIYATLGDYAQQCLDLCASGVKGKIVIGFHGGDASSVLKRAPHSYDELFRIGSLFLPACHYFKRRLITHGADPEKTVVIHDTIELEKFTFKKRVPNPDGTINVITVARLVQKKGLEYSIRAMARVMKKNKKITYKIIGHGQLHKKLQALINSLGMQDRIILMGYKPYNRVAHYLDNSHIFVLSSITARDGNQEATPNVLKEALASGLPVVSTYHAGIPELIEDGISGFLVPECDVDALVEKIEYLIAHSEIWHEMAWRGREKVERAYETHKENKKLIELFSAL